MRIISAFARLVGVSAMVMLAYVLFICPYCFNSVEEAFCIYEYNFLIRSVEIILLVLSSVWLFGEVFKEAIARTR